MGRLNALRDFIMSKPAMVALVLLACLVTVTGQETLGLFVFIVITVFNLLVCDELLASTLPFLLISTFMNKCFDSFDKYIKIAWIIPFVVLLIVAHFVLYRKPIKAGSTVWSLIGVSVAVTMGGIGSITLKEYFSLTSVYYMAGLGVGMLLCYILVYSYLESTERADLHRTFAYIMYLVGIFACAMILMHYLVNIQKVIENRSILEFQWRNNISTVIMLTMPFGFYLSVKSPHCIIPALLTMPCLALSSSRGGLVFGAVEFLFCIIYILYADKAHRNRNLITIGICALGLILLSGDIIAFISKTLTRFEISSLENDPRAGFIQRAIEDYQNCPIFGRGIGYMGNMDIYASKKFAANWYHSYPFQVIGSFGTLGILAYGYQFFRRSRVFWSRISYFTLAVYISYIGVFMMSLVNPGEFCPVPYEFMVVFMFAVIEHRSPCNKEKVLFTPKKPLSAPEKAEAKTEN